MVYVELWEFVFRIALQATYQKGGEDTNPTSNSELSL